MNTDPQSIYQLARGTILKERYQIDSVLGQGGFGITYKGTDLMLEMTVAVKEFFPHGFATRSTESSSSVILTTGQGFFDKWRDRFLAEARTLAKCTDVPAIVEVRDFFEENNTAYIVMEYLSGISLQDYLRRSGVIPVQKMFAYMIPLVRDLDHVHQLGLIHRDISPDNIMLMPDDTLKLFDFGAARLFSDEEPRTLSIMLKPGYAPEEQYRKKGIQGPWTDVYAICATIYKCITGVTPPDSLERLNEDELRAPSELGCRITAGMEQILLRGMSLRGENRYQSAASLADAMEASMKDAADLPPDITVTMVMDDTEAHIPEVSSSGNVDSKPVSKDQPPEEHLPEKSLKKKKILPWILAAAGAMAALICILVLTNRQKPPIQPGRETASQGPETIVRMTDGDYEPVSENALLDSVFWGIHFCEEDNLNNIKRYIDIVTDTGTLNVSEVPLAFLVNPAWNTEPLICLCFTDQFQHLFFVYGTYQIENDIFTVSAPAFPEAVPQLNPSDLLDHTYLSYNHKYICEAGTSYPAEGKAYLMQDTIQLSWRLEYQTHGSIVLKNDGKEIQYESGYLNGEYGSGRFLYLRGSASDPERLYKNMAGLDLIYNVTRDEDETAVIYYADGGKSLDTVVTYYSKQLGSVDLQTTEVSRPYNGRTETFNEKSTLGITFINTYPYGFIIREHAADGDNFYYYQKTPD